jgi:hypothetical protein
MKKPNTTIDYLVITILTLYWLGLFWMGKDEISRVFSP